MRCLRLLPFVFFALTASLFAQSNPALFAPAVTYGSGGSYAYSVAVGDVNRDGKPDLVIANYCGMVLTCADTVGVLLGNGDGTFQTAVTYGSGGFLVHSVTVADVNGDGNPDIVVADWCPEALNAASTKCTRASIDTLGVGVLLGNGDGTFQTAVTYSSGGAYASVAVGDINGDGKPDLVVTNECGDRYCANGTVGVLLGNGNGTFQPAKLYSSGGFYTHSPTVGDVNGDSNPDIVVMNSCTNDAGMTCATSTVGVVLGNGDGTFQPAMTYSSGGSGSYDTNAVTLAEVNDDGKPDIVVANNCVSVHP